MDSSSQSKAVAVRQRVWSRDVQGAVCLLYRGCQTAQLIPEERERPALHANEHAPTKWPVHSPVSFPLSLNPLPPHLSALTLLPAVCRLTHAQKKHAESQPPLHTEGGIYLTGGKSASGVSTKTPSEKCQRETNNPITPTVSSVMAGCISCCLHQVHYWNLVFCLSVLYLLKRGATKHGLIFSM